MKVVTFFSAKGGVGKTTLSVIFSSWLSYSQKEKVFVTDFDYPSHHFFSLRQHEINVFNDPEQGAALRRMTLGNTLYPITKCNGKTSFTQEELASIVAGVRREKFNHPENCYLILDFPGRFLPDDPVNVLVRNGLVDLVVFLADTDRQSKSDAVMVNKEMSRNHQKTLVLWNREAQNERTGKRDWYSGAEKTFNMLGIPVCKTRMRDILILRRDAETTGFIRSTMCFPESNIRKYCPYITDIFTEIKSRLDGTWRDEE